MNKLDETVCNVLNTAANKIVRYGIDNGEYYSGYYFEHALLTCETEGLESTLNKLSKIENDLLAKGLTGDSDEYLALEQITAIRRLIQLTVEYYTPTTDPAQLTKLRRLKNNSDPIATREDSAKTM